MSTTFISAQENLPSEGDEIVVQESAKPWLRKAGYIHESELTAHIELGTR